MESKFMRGALILSTATLISKILGFIYIIPFTNLVGAEGYALYKYAYGPYTILLSISTIGLPLAVSKLVSKYNELGNYSVGLTVLRYGLILMIFSGFISFIALYSFAPFLADIITDSNDLTGNSWEDVLFVIRLVSFSLLIIPAMSIFRGYFQGSQSMGPSALSTVIEQIVRIVFILVGGYVTIHILESSVTNAVGIATFAAFVGGLAGLGVLLIVYFKRRGLIMKQRDASPDNVDIKIIPLFKELIGYSLPFVIAGLTIPIYQNIDTFTINKLFQSIGYSLNEAEIINSVIGLAQILVLVPVSLATAFGMSLIPGITTSFVSGKMEEVHNKITQTIQILLFFTLPAGMGLCLLGKPVYIMLFGLDTSPQLGGQILQWYALAAVVFALFTVTTAIMQGINKQKKVIIGIGVGIVVKISLNVLLVPDFKELAPILATYCGFSVSVLYNVYVIKKAIHFHVKPLIQSLIPMTGIVIVMSLAVLGVKYSIDILLSNEWGTNSHARISSILSIVTGILVYLGLGRNLKLVKEFKIFNRRKSAES